MSIDLQTLLAYKNTRVMARYNKDYPHAKLSADEALTELMKYIWLCRQHRLDKTNDQANKALNFTCVIHQEMLEIDYMWHTFLLFTRDYKDFCDEYLEGKFFHHQPIESDDEPLNEEKYKTELERYLSYIYDKLGEETLIKWFSDCV